LSRLGQPCCKYYTDAIDKDSGHSKVVILSENRLNPCVDVLIARGGVFRDNSSWLTDLTMMVYARRIILSGSSLSKAIMLLSPVRKVFYTFNEFGPDGSKGRLYRFWRFGRHWHCIPNTEYYQKVMNSTWKVSDAQLGMMLTENCTWETLPRSGYDWWSQIVILDINL
jgi:hypothetical protein